MYILSCCVYTSITYTNIQNPGDNTNQFSTKIRSEITDQMSSDNVCKLLTLSFAILFTGNIMDNATGHERKVMVWLDICMGLALIFWAAVFYEVKEYYVNDRAKLDNNIDFFE